MGLPSFGVLVRGCGLVHPLNGRDLGYLSLPPCGSEGWNEGW